MHGAKAPCILCTHIRKILQVVAHTLGGGTLVHAEGHGELHTVCLAEAVQPVQEVLHIGQTVAAYHLGEIVYKYMRNIVITGVQAADEASQALKRIQIIFLAIDQTHAGLNVKG